MILEVQAMDKVSYMMRFKQLIIWDHLLEHKAFI